MLGSLLSSSYVVLLLGWVYWSYLVRKNWYEIEGVMMVRPALWLKQSWFFSAQASSSSKWAIWYWSCSCFGGRCHKYLMAWNMKLKTFVTGMRIKCMKRHSAQLSLLALTCDCTKMWLIDVIGIPAILYQGILQTLADPHHWLSLLFVHQEYLSGRVFFLSDCMKRFRKKLLSRLENSHDQP